MERDNDRKNAIKKRTEISLWLCSHRAMHWDFITYCKWIGKNAMKTQSFEERKLIPLKTENLKKRISPKIFAKPQHTTWQRVKDFSFAVDISDNFRIITELAEGPPLEMTEHIFSFWGQSSPRLQEDGARGKRTLRSVTFLTSVWHERNLPFQFITCWQTW